MQSQILSDALDVNLLALVGEGAQGRVYRLDEDRCIKVYKKSKYYHRELEVLRQSQSEPCYPKLYGWRKNQIIREYIPGIPLAEYLRNHPISDMLCEQLLELYFTFERLKFHRLDTRLEHIILTPDGVLRIIDPTNANVMKENYPRRMLLGLESLGYKDTFLEYVAKHAPHIYKQWIH